ncbi:hypothetical protein H2198_003246 [Neophaeococcomyces mojaviensis]|uniref:Uncharacterized protein n=1 Tax=Neophaeococcomyces mojaviensis TaxID=3383035 RepID=A0ACC3ABX8_9EURO|nr:hypothetical protein H2198_003246 [Knufia sp. JES_112]
MVLPVGHRFVHYIEIQRMSSPDATELNMQARRALDFFQHQTALQLDGPFTIDLCSKWLSRLMQHDTAIKHGVIALATLHESFMQPSLAGTDERKILALHHYGKSINGVVQLNAKAPGSVSATTLVTCLLYCLIESLQGHFHSAWKHIIAGIQLLAEVDQGLLSHGNTSADIPQPLLDLLRRVLVSLGTQATALQDGPVDPMAIQHIKNSHRTVNEVFTSTEEALAELSHLVNDVLQAMTWVDISDVDVDWPSEDFVLAREALESRLSSWALAFKNLLVTDSNRTTDPRDRSDIALLILRVNQILCRVIMTCMYTKSQTAFDACLEDFQMIVQITKSIIAIEQQQEQSRPNSPSNSPPLPASSRPTFSMMLGIIPALFFVCIRCRHQETRRQALQILLENRRRETCWDSYVVGRAAEKHIMIEEQRMARYWRETQTQGDGPSIRHQPDSELARATSESADSNWTDTTHMPENMRLDRLDVDFTTEKSAVLSFAQTQSGERYDMVMEWDD